MKPKRTYIWKTLALWLFCIVAFLVLWELGYDYYEYSTKSALPKHVLKQVYLYRDLLSIIGFGILALWLFSRREKRYQEELLRSHRVMVLEKFSSFVAHEIRNPLTSLNLNAELIQGSIEKLEDPKMEELRHLMNSVIGEVTHLSNTTEQYLNFRNKDMKIKNFKISSAIDELMLTLKPKAESIGVQIQMRLESISNAELQGDKRRFQIAFQRLIENAFEAMPQGGVVTIGGASRRRSFNLTISDTGVGMTQEVQNHLFEPFFTTKLKSAGLGLCLVRQIVGECQGTISYRSAVGKGTSFQIRFPLIKSKS
jgi:signal transduction histidine kinase